MGVVKIGADEAGRGPLAGSLFASASTLFPSSLSSNLLEELTDSKKLSQKKRFQLYSKIKEYKNKHLFFSCSSKSPEFIDKYGIQEAVYQAMAESVRRVVDLVKERIEESEIKILVDGHLRIKGLEYESKPVINGDEKVPEISLSSIVAKCEKDLESIKLKDKYPEFSFDQHKGYGTKKHIQEIKEFGVKDCHRESFSIVKEQQFSKKYHELKGRLTSAKELFDLDNSFFDISFNEQMLSKEEFNLLKREYKKRKRKLD